MNCSQISIEDHLKYLEQVVLNSTYVPAIKEGAIDAINSIRSMNTTGTIKFDNLVTELIWDTDRAVKQAKANDGKYETLIAFILNKNGINSSGYASLENKEK